MRKISRPAVHPGVLAALVALLLPCTDCFEITHPPHGSALELDEDGCFTISYR